MFDVEYGENLRTPAVREIRSVGVSRLALLQLSEAALRAAESEVSKWHEEKVADITAALMRDKSSGLRRLLSRVCLQTIPVDEDHAQNLAKEAIKRYPSFQRCWRAEDAVTAATRWLGAAKKLTLIESFDVPVAEFDDLRNWASKA